MQQPLVSITIPTLDSEKTLARTLQSVAQQTYQNIEVIIIDSYSQDSTREIAKQHKASFYLERKKLLGARRTGVEKSKGDIIVLLDSDQILHPRAIERSVECMQHNDMLFLEEDSYNPKTTVEKLASIDRRMTHRKQIEDPSMSVLLPRVYAKELLQRALAAIPEPLFEYITLQDHAIIYYECYKLSKKVGYVPNAVYHKEPASIKELFTHYKAWGVRGNEYSDKMPIEYKTMFSKKLRNRNKSVVFASPYFILALPVIAIKALGYYAGIRSITQP